MRNSHEYVEIGGVKWATMNVGAEKETDIGLYFQHCVKQGYSHPTNLCKFDKAPKKRYDSVQAYWGDNWRMPTKEDFYALFRNTTNEWVENYKDSGVNGRLFTDKNDNSKTLFFPACGFCLDGCVNGVGDYGFYWSGSICSDYVYGAWFLNFCDGNMFMDSSYNYYGFVVRGICKR